jgi:hypothetical protein
MRSIQITDYSLKSYEAFLAAKRTPIHRVEGNTIYIEDCECNDIDGRAELATHLWDYQQFITRLCLLKKRFAVFANIGLGKTAIFLEWVRHVSKRVYPKKTLIITQLHLIDQTMREQLKFYGWTNITDINLQFKGSVQKFLDYENQVWEGIPVGIVNVDKFREPFALQEQIGAIVLDESSILKNSDGKLRTNIINACKGIPYKLACTATPAPNDRQEYASHALFLDYITNYKQFFNKFFFNTGNGNEYVLKPHARRGFYEFLSTWSIFLRSPKQFGFEDNLVDLLPPEIVWDEVELTFDQMVAAEEFGTNKGMVNRLKASQISKGFLY